jgi:hypothetical protein
MVDRGSENLMWTYGIRVYSVLHTLATECIIELTITKHIKQRQHMTLLVVLLLLLLIDHGLSLTTRKIPTGGLSGRIWND